MIEERVTYCRICEPLCGLVATVEDGVLTKLRPDKDHPISQGFACPKGIAMTEVQNSPDRLTRPAKRRADGTFETVSWAEAMTDIGSRLRQARAEHGPDAIGFFFGNPGAFSYSSLVWAKGLSDALGSTHFYASASQDINSRYVASALLYGSVLRIPVPDLARTDLAILIGANPVTSHGSLIAGVNVRKELNGIVERGGRVIVVDPRRTETARQYEHLSVIPDGDPYLLLSVLHVLFAEDLVDDAAMSRLASGRAELAELVEGFPPEETAAYSGVAAGAVRALARDLAAAPSAAIYGRVGAQTGGFSTLVSFLIDVLAVVTGNIDVPGGSVFPTPPVDLYESMIKNGLDTYATKHSRVGGHPELLGMMPGAILADEILTPGPGQLRALILLSGNPVLSLPQGRRLEGALGELDLFVALDIGINDTSRHADYVLPATTFLEREDLPLQMFPLQLQTFVQWTEPVVAPRGEARQEWEIIRDLAAELGVVPASVPALRRLGWIGRRLLKPQPMFDAMLRLGPFGDRFGLRRGGISVKKLKSRHPHGVILRSEVPTGVLPQRITHTDGRIHLLPDPIVGEIERLVASQTSDPEFPLRLIGRRELRAINSWMREPTKLRIGETGPTCLIHPTDAAEADIAEGEYLRIVSGNGSTDAVAEITDTVRQGTVSLPHGSGRRVRIDGSPDTNGGPDYNALTKSGPGSVDPLSGNAIFTGVRVRVERVSP